MHSPLENSQTLSLRSPPPVHRILPEGAKRTAFTSPSWASWGQGRGTLVRSRAQTRADGRTPERHAAFRAHFSAVWTGAAEKRDPPSYDERSFQGTSQMQGLTPIPTTG